jgi:hypothetical protein
MTGAQLIEFPGPSEAAHAVPSPKSLGEWDTGGTRGQGCTAAAEGSGCQALGISQAAAAFEDGTPEKRAAKGAGPRADIFDLATATRPRRQPVWREPIEGVDYFSGEQLPHYLNATDVRTASTGGGLAAAAKSTPAEG